MSTRILLTSLFATALTLPVWAQIDTLPPGQPAATVATVEGAEPSASSVSRDRDTLSVDFPDEDIKTILRNVADLFELNLVVPDTLTGKTSIKLRDVTWRQIFNVVLAPVGYTYLEEGNIIKVVSNDLLLQEPVATEVFILNNAKASDIKPTIDGLVDAASGGKIVIDARSNALVITERPSRMGRIRGIIEQLDKATDQVMIEAKFVEVTDRDIRNIGVNWASLQGMQFGVGGMSQSFTRDRGQAFTNGAGNSSSSTNGTNSSDTSGTSTTDSNGTTSGTTTTTTTTTTGPTSSSSTTGTGATSNATTVVSNGDLLTFNPTTGLPTVTVVPPVTNTTTTSSPATSTTSTTSTTGGTQTNGTSGTAGGTTGSSSQSITSAITNGMTSSLTNAINSLADLTNTGGTSRLTSAVFTASDFNVIISALKQQSNTKIISNPTVTTLNNTEASLNIGEEFPIPSYTYNSERGSFEVSGFEYKPIGVILKVTPQVNAQGVIKMFIEPEVSQRNGSTSFGGAGGASIPIIATRKVSTTISLNDGSTAGIGGLITSSQEHGGTKVPVLGSIPVLGRLFSSKSVNDSITNLLIFITAKTVTAEGASPESVFDPRAIQAVGMTREDLPGNRAPAGTDVYMRAPTMAK